MLRNVPHAIGYVIGTTAGAAIITLFGAAVLVTKLCERRKRCPEECPCRSTPEAAERCVMALEAMEEAWPA